ncbi:DUF4129 domain-containing protein [Spirosoma sp. BT702]|uniref:DUF4129 domain-containing protein n=1 Tax=Spirosoma profusum TaxID=2771354 RepID=A0A927AQ46_9BACT|nr:DUF4129 domain-containing protein [Spirosoma profusum]MBD2699611.1 DUF4129 domain-containing protein [Spirosoma profusum]
MPFRPFKQLRICLFFWLFWLALTLSGVPEAVGQQKPTSSSINSARDDRALLRVRYPDSEQLRDLQTDRDYQYGTDAPPPENPLARFFTWIVRKIYEFLNSKAYQNFWQYVFLAAIAGLAIYLLMKAEVLGFLFPKKAQSGDLDYENLSENIHEIDFKTAIEEAVSAKNFRLAIRLLYLQTLKRLTDAGAIIYKPDKTNRQYVAELANVPLQADFEQLTRQFEFVWYGDFPVDEIRFNAIQAQFGQFNLSSKSKFVKSTL